ncbi:MAG: hypothetical protein JNM56_27240 [Planctomycetia bacterium]|nr:hypothetical protein [Planctomycetia bacterium]
MTSAPTEHADPAIPFPPAFLALVERAQAGDLEVLPALRQALDTCPDIWLRVGDLAQHARLILLQDLAANDLLLRESVTRKLDAMQEELHEEGDGPLHRLLIERVVLGWLELHALDARCRTLREQFSTPPQMEALERRRLSCQKRYLAAIRSLGMVRKLLRRAPSPVEIASRLRAASPASRSATCPERQARSSVGVCN